MVLPAAVRVDELEVAHLDPGGPGVVGGETGVEIEVLSFIGSSPIRQYAEDWDLARSLAKEYEDILGKGRFFLELQDHGIPAQKQTNPQLLEIAKRIGAPLLATNDSHYTHRHDCEAHDALLCVQTGALMADPDRFKFHGDQHYLKTAEEMRYLWRELPEGASSLERDLLPALAARAWVLTDYNSGQTLAQRNDSERAEPASLTKLMTAYVVFQALRDKKIDALIIVGSPTSKYVADVVLDASRSTRGGNRRPTVAPIWPPMVEPTAMVCEAGLEEKTGALVPLTKIVAAVLVTVPLAFVRTTA